MLSKSATNQNQHDLVTVFLVLGRSLDVVDQLNDGYLVGMYAIAGSVGEQRLD
jgi:hypothetical protein